MTIDRAQRKVWLPAGLTLLVVLLAMPFFDARTNVIMTFAFIVPMLLLTTVRSVRAQQAAQH